MGKVTERMAEEEGMSSMPRPVRVHGRSGGALTERDREPMSWGEQGEPVRTHKKGGASAPQVGVGDGDMRRSRRGGRGAGDGMNRTRGPKRGRRAAGARGSVKLAPNNAGGNGGGIRPSREEDETGT